MSCSFFPSPSLPPIYNYESFKNRLLNLTWNDLRKYCELRKGLELTLKSEDVGVWMGEIE